MPWSIREAIVAKSMGEYSPFMARDGTSFRLGSPPHPDAARALVVIQEIFGVNSHIRKVTDGFAATVTRRSRPACSMGAARYRARYSAAEMQEGSGYTSSDAGRYAARSRAALAVVKHRPGATVATAGAEPFVSCGLSAAARLRGGVLRPGRELLDQKTRCPVMYHYGKEDGASRRRRRADQGGNPHAP